MFRLFDKDNSGSISFREIYTVLRSLGQDPEDDDIMEMIEALDKDGRFFLGVFIWDLFGGWGYPGWG